MSSPSPSKDTFRDPSVAMKFRDFITDTVSNVVARLRPEPQYGTVLSVYRGGAEFRIGDALAPEGPPPVGPGNPRQAYYASIRLDTGEVVTARVHENIPVFRPAAFYDQTSNEGSTEPYLISQDVYRRRVVVPRADESGNIYDSVEPEVAHLSGPPVVPPRVMIEGHAGKYVLTRIVRGMVRIENAVLDSPYLVNAGEGYSHVLDPARPDVTELRTTRQSYTTQYQGFVGDCGWLATGSFEAELRYGSRYQKYTFSMQDVTPDEWGNWRLIVPTIETTGHKDVGFNSDEAYNVLLGYVDATGYLFLYVCSRNLAEFTIDENKYLGGSFTFTSINHQLTASLDITKPVEPIPAGTSAVWGLTRTRQVLRSVSDYGINTPGSSPFLAQVHHNQLTFSGGGVPQGVFVGSAVYFKWTSRFIIMTAVSPWCPNGYFEINMPAVGTEIPRVGAKATDGGPLASVVVDANGIGMGTWDGLYYVPPYETYASVPGNFVLTSYSGWFDIPHHWILVAKRHADSPDAQLMLGNGQDVPVWRSFTPNVPGAVNTASYPPMVTKIGNIVYLCGGITAGSGGVVYGASSTNGAIPAGHRPYRRWIGPALYTPNAGGHISRRLDVANNGNIQLFLALASTEELWFDGVSYPAWA